MPHNNYSRNPAAAAGEFLINNNLTTTIIINTLAINVDECLTSRRMLKSACVYILKSTSRRLIMIDLKLHDDSVDDDVSH